MRVERSLGRDVSPTGLVVEADMMRGKGGGWRANGDGGKWWKMMIGEGLEVRSTEKLIDESVSESLHHVPGTQS